MAARRKGCARRQVAEAAKRITLEAAQREVLVLGGRVCNEQCATALRQILQGPAP